MNTATLIPIIRHVLQFVAGILIAKGWLTDKEATEATGYIVEASGPILALGTLVWMMRDKKKVDAEQEQRWAAPIIAAFLGVALGVSGCAKILPGNDPALVNAERTTVLAVDVFDTFLKWEYENRQTLSVQPEVKKAADLIRVKGPDWLATARSMTEAYRTGRTPENKANLETAVAILRTGIREAQKYLAAGAPPPMPK